jgi:ferredoxin
MSLNLSDDNNQKVKKMSEESYEGIPRNKIDWHPIINYEKCVSCGKCVDFCHVKSFGYEDINGKKKTIVQNLNACVVLCRGCEDICPVGAITHPSEEETQKLIEKLKQDKV